MSYPKWLQIIKKNTDEIQVDKIRQETISVGEMAAGSPSVAAEKLTRILEQQKATTKILIVGDGTFSAKLSDYAIKMGQRLDCEIIALSVFDKHWRENRAPEEAETAHFMKRSELGAAAFTNKAVSAGVKSCQLVQIGAREDVVDLVVKEIAGIRYVLSEPDDNLEKEQSEQIQLPVIDTTGTKLQTK